MNKRFVIHIISRVLLFVCLLMLVPLGWAIYDDMHSREVYSFVFTLMIGLIISSFVFWKFPLQEKDYKRLNIKDSLAVVGLSWIALSLFGAIPLYLSGSVHCFTDGFFEIVSGFTTTGATIFTDVESLPRGILFWRSLTHWLGGMGIIVLYLALLPSLGQNAYRIYKAEAPGITAERIEPGSIKETAKVLWAIYFLLSFLETVFLMFGGMSLFEALCHTFGTMATGGFSTRNSSVGAYSGYIQWVIIVFMFLAGSNFMLHYQLLRGKLRAYFKNEEWRDYFLTIVVMIVFFHAVLWASKTQGASLRSAAFQVISILTTTGFTTADFDLWPNILRFMLIVLMFIGACGGSTGGGMKIVRLFLSMKVALRALYQTIFPNAVLPIRFNKTRCSETLVMAVVSYFIIYIILFFIGTILMVLIERCDIVTALAASIATLSNIGPGLAGVGATQNYAWISVPGKWILTGLMLAGRLELYAILILFVPATWKK